MPDRRGSLAYDEIMSDEKSEQRHKILGEVEQAHGRPLVTLDANLADLNQAKQTRERNDREPNENARDDPTAPQSVAEFFQCDDTNTIQASTSWAERRRATA
jgi:hypothetical protein